MNTGAVVSKLAPLLLELVGLAIAEAAKDEMTQQGAVGGREMKGTDG